MELRMARAIFKGLHAAPMELETAWCGVLFYKHAAPKGAKDQPCGLIEK
jgi:hypothetical protein